MEIRFKNSNILADLDKIFEGSKNPEKLKFKNCCMRSLDRLHIFLPNQNWYFWTIKAIGGSRVNKTFQAYFVELIAVVSTLFTECQNSTRF